MADPAVAIAAVFSVRCHRCSRHIGEAEQQLELVAIVKKAKMTGLVRPPRRSWVCKFCGWTSVFDPVT